MANTAQQQSIVDWYKGLNQAPGQGFSGGDFGDIEGFTKSQNPNGNTDYMDAPGGAMGGGGGVPGGGAAPGGSTGGGAKVVDPSPPSMAGLETAAGGGGGLGEPGGPGDSLSGPNQFRQGIGTRMLPQLNQSLAGILRAY